MKTLATFIQETTHQLSFDPYINAIREAWLDQFPTSSIFFQKPSLGKDYFYVTCVLGKDKSDFNNGIMDNDPLSLRMTVTVGEDESSTIEFMANHFTIKPSNQHNAYDSSKIPLRKTKALSLKELNVKVSKAFNKVYNVGKGLHKEGQFDVYQGKPAMKKLDYYFK